jgi:hypothetical protein
MPLQQTSGNVTADAYGGGVAAIPNYIEEVFNTYVWTGTGSDQTLTTGIDTSTYGGMFWTKNRTTTSDHALWSTNFSIASGNYLLKSNTTGALTYGIYGTGDYVSNSTTGVTVYGNPENYVTWTFRKQPKFFDVVTYTGNGTNGRTVAHNLGSVPGCMIVKRTDASNGWAVYHRSMNASPQDYMMRLNADSAPFTTSPSRWNNTLPTATEFTLSGNDEVNGSGATYVAYLFAHNAGGFGLTGTDNVISCGSFSCPGGADATVNLGYEPQWVLFKDSGADGNWQIADNMRGFFAYPKFGSSLYPNLSATDSANQIGINLTSTGFQSVQGQLNGTFIYIAIRRGPMKVHTSGTSVFLPTSRTGNATLTTVTSGFAPDVVFARRVDTLDNDNESVFADKVRGSGTLSTNNTAAEYNGGATSGLNAYTNTGVVLGTNNSPIYAFNYSGLPYALYQFQRAPNFMDEVCYTGTGSNMTISHNLGVVPELMIVKMRSTATFTGYWYVYASGTGNTKYGLLSLTNSFSTSSGAWNNTTPTASSFYVGTDFAVSETGKNFVAYLFATCAGVSKVGSYTGTGSTQTISCGFTGGARFVLIKRTDSTGNWYVWDTARGMVSGTDPKFGFNLTSAQTNADWVYTTTGGFQIVATDAEVNASGGTYIFLAIA